MPSSGWLSALTRHFTRTPSVPRAHAHTRECGREGGNGIAIVSQNASPAPPSRPTTPWSLDTLDDEIQRAQDQKSRHPRRSSLKSYDSPSAMSVPVDPAGRGSGSRPTSGSSRPSSSVSRPTSGASRPTSGASSLSSRPPSAPSRPASAAFHISGPGHQLLRSQTSTEVPEAATSCALPQQIEDELYESYVLKDARGHYFIPPVIPPLYDPPVAGPTPMSTRCNTPVWDLDGEKRVRFLEPEVVGDIPSRPPSVTSQYSQVLKNSTRFMFQQSQSLMGDPGGHNPRYCNCPCHFFPSGRKSVGIQVKRTDPEPRPRHYRLFFLPTMRGLDTLTLGTKSISVATRVLFSQIGLAAVLVAWWVAGAAVFSAVEGAAETKTVDRMAALRTDLVLGLATELRQVLPYDLLWRTKIETYMGRLENAVLEAARAGYASRAPTWTLSGALLYAASLTTLVGPGGMTLRTGFSRVFAVLFSLVGAPLVLLLAVSGAFTLREGVGKAWAWRCGRGKQSSRVGDGRGGQAESRADQYGSGRGGSAVSTLNLAANGQNGTPEPGPSTGANGPSTLPGPSSLPGPSTLPPSDPPRSAKPSEMQKTSRVPALDSTLRSSTSSGLTTFDPEEGDMNGITTVPTDATTDLQVTDPFPTDALALQMKGAPPPYPPPLQRRNSQVPWVVYVVILLIYLLLGLAIFAPIQRWSLPSALYILSSTLLSLDHECLGERQTLGSSKIIVPYVLYMLLGVVLVTSFVMSVWSSLCASLVSTGKYLAVVRPTR